jgi:CBS domain-containing protein
MKAKDVMSRHVFTLSPGNSVAHAAQIMLDNAIGGLPVMDSEGALVGIVTEGDLVSRIELGHTVSSDMSKPEACDDFVKSHGWCVGDVMTTPVVTVSEETTVEEIAQLFDTRKIKRVAVTRHGHLVGLVSRADLLEVIARSKPPVIASGDEALRLSIASRLRGTFRLANPPTVSVVHGIIHLSGTLHSENERRAIRVLVDGVPGGNGVEDHMRIDHDGEGGQSRPSDDGGAK